MKKIQSDIIFRNILGSGYEETMLEWRNQEYVRKSMINSSVISREQHLEFLDNLKQNKTKEYFIGLIDNTPFAVINFDYSDGKKEVEIGVYLVDETYINKGYSLILEYAKCKYIFDKAPDYRIIGKVKETNIKNLSTQRSLRKKETGTEEIRMPSGENSLLYVFEADIHWWNNERPRIERIINVFADCEKIKWI